MDLIQLPLGKNPSAVPFIFRNENNALYEPETMFIKEVIMDYIVCGLGIGFGMWLYKDLRKLIFAAMKKILIKYLEHGDKYKTDEQLYRAYCDLTDREYSISSRTDTKIGF
jgi:hypothetical protein